MFAQDSYVKFRNAMLIDEPAKEGEEKVTHRIESWMPLKVEQAIKLGDSCQAMYVLSVDCAGYAFKFIATADAITGVKQEYWPKYLPGDRVRITREFTEAMHKVYQNVVATDSYDEMKTYKGQETEVTNAFWVLSAETGRVLRLVYTVSADDTAHVWLSEMLEDLPAEQG